MANMEEQTDTQTSEGVAAKYWSKLPSGKIRCDLCPRACLFKEGRRGVCESRQREGDRLVLTAYGRSSGFCVDPIEKKPLNHFYPGSSVLSFGSVGCNLSCEFCQNWNTSKGKPEGLTTATAPEAIAEAAAQRGCKSVAFTYNATIISLEYVAKVGEACRELGVKTVAVTNGCVNPEPRREFFSFIDAANVDLKSFSAKFYKELTGGDLRTVLDTLKYVANETSVWLEITNLIIPDENDDEQELRELAKWVRVELSAEVPLHFSAFHPSYKMLDKPSTPLKTLIKAREIALESGLRHVYTGNAHYPPGDTTFCGDCGDVLIERNWSEIKQYRLTESAECPSCRSKLAGRFDPKPGNWGARQTPVGIR